MCSDFCGTTHLRFALHVAVSQAVSAFQGLLLPGPVSPGLWQTAAQSPAATLGLPSSLLWCTYAVSALYFSQLPQKGNR